MWQDNILRCYLRFSFLNFFYSLPFTHLVNAFIAPGKGCCSRKAKKRLLNFCSVCLWGEKNTLDPEGTQAIKIRWEKSYLQSDQLCLILSYLLRSVISTHGLLSSLNFFRLEKERGETLNMFENLRKDVIVDILLLLDMRKPTLKPWERGQCKGFLMSRGSKMSGSVSK